MPLRLVITSYQRQRLKQAGVREFGTHGGSIGRSLESDWVLVDGTRYVSSRHACIDFRSGSYYIIDTSSNGVYVNDEAKCVGKRTAQRLFDGDRVRIGEYEMVAHIAESAIERAQLADDRHVDPVDRARFVEQAESTGLDLISANELTAEGVQDMLAEGAEARALKRAANAAAAVTEISKRRKKAQTGPSKSAAGSRRPKGSSGTSKSRPSVALYAFYRGAGLAPKDIDEQQAAFMLHRAGRLMRQLLAGLTDALHFREEQMRKVLVPSTDTQPQSDHSRIFSAGVDAALNTLISDPAAESQSTVDATREAFEDVKIHQKAMLGAVRAAVSGLIARLDPDEVEESFEHSVKRNTLLGDDYKKRYWDRYRDVFQAMSPQSRGQFPQQFAAELSRVYEEATARLKGKRRTDNAAQDVTTRAEAG